VPASAPNDQHKHIKSPTDLHYGAVSVPDPEIEAELEQVSKVFKTYLPDVECQTSQSKVGPHGDGKAGGCDNILVRISGGQLGTPSYWVPAAAGL